MELLVVFDDGNFNGADVAKGRNGETIRRALLFLLMAVKVGKGLVVEKACIEHTDNPNANNPRIAEFLIVYLVMTSLMEWKLFTLSLVSLLTGAC